MRVGRRGGQSRRRTQLRRTSYLRHQRPRLLTITKAASCNPAPARRRRLHSSPSFSATAGRRSARSASSACSPQPRKTESMLLLGTPQSQACAGASGFSPRAIWVVPSTPGPAPTGSARSTYAGWCRPRSPIRSRSRGEPAAVEGLELMIPNPDFDQVEPGPQGQCLDLGSLWPA